jgi:sugar lactone lactonase YvrE
MLRFPVRRGLTMLAAAFAAALSAAPALAAKDCTPSLAAPKPALTAQGSLESVIVSPSGQLYYTDTTAKAVMRLDHPGAKPVPVVTGIESPGGMAFDADPRFLFVTQGDAIVNGVVGNFAPSSILYRVDLQTRERKVFATGLAMGNGLVRDAKGYLYASDDLGFGIDRISPDGKVQNNWATVPSGNGLALDSSEQHLFANQTFVPAAVQRVTIDTPAKVETWARPGPEDMPAGLDGLAIDRMDRLAAAVNLYGQVWRINADRSICVLAHGLANASAVAYGHGDGGFPEGHLYVVTFGGIVAEVPAGYVEPLPAAAAPVKAKAKAKAKAKKKHKPAKRKKKHRGRRP